jgi:hypothetical protein
MKAALRLDRDRGRILTLSETSCPTQIVVSAPRLAWQFYLVLFRFLAQVLVYPKVSTV